MASPCDVGGGLFSEEVVTQQLGSAPPLQRHLLVVGCLFSEVATQQLGGAPLLQRHLLVVGCLRMIGCGQKFACWPDMLGPQREVDRPTLGVFLAPFASSRTSRTRQGNLVDTDRLGSGVRGALHVGESKPLHRLQLGLVWR